MPELPDVERFKMYVDATSLHQTVARVEVRDAAVLAGIAREALRSSLEGRAFEGTSRHGKFLFLHPEFPPLLVLHFGMTGYLDYARCDREPPKHTRVVFEFAKGYRLAYVCQRKLGNVAVADDRKAFIEQHRLGPDALDEQFVFDAFAERLSGRRTGIKSALMDQAVMAGVGNIYADEVLYQAGIAPQRRVPDLDEAALRKVYQAMRRVLKTAIRHKAEVSQFPRTYLLRRREADGRCPGCDNELKTARIGGRGAYFCPHCQR